MSDAKPVRRSNGKRIPSWMWTSIDGNQDLADLWMQIQDYKKIIEAKTRIDHYLYVLGISNSVQNEVRKEAEIRLSQANRKTATQIVTTLTELLNHGTDEELMVAECLLATLPFNR